MSDSEASIEESDDEFSYDAPTVGGVPPSHLSLPKKVLDQHYDEAVDVSASDADSARSPINSSAKHLNQPMNPSNSISSNHTLKGNLSNASSSFDSDDDEPTDVDPTGFAAVPARPAQLSNSKPTSAKASPPSSQPTQQRRTPPLATQQPMQRAEQTIASGSEDEEDEDEDDTAAAPATRPTQAKLYQASDFAHIHVHAEIQELFVLIGRHKPQDIELDTKFLPFIPDYIPAIGEIDPFIKVSAPQNIGGVEDLGLKVVDEPSSNQSDPSVLEMSLRVLSKGVSTRSTNNAKVENAEKNPKRITKWIESLEELHRAKPQTKVTYTKPMPDIDTLMQVWPQDVEDTIKQFSVGSSDDQDPLFGLNLSTMELAKLGCALMDIPIHGDDKIIESLHLMFSVYQEFSQNAHFQGQ